MLVDWDNDQIGKYTIVKLTVKIHNVNYSKAIKVNEMECDVLVTNAKRLNQKEAGAVWREKQNKFDPRLDYCLSAKLMTGLAASGGNAVSEPRAFPSHHTRSLPGLLSTHSWASLGKMASALSQFIKNCFNFVDTKDQIILTFFIADEINYRIHNLGVILPITSCPDLR